MLEKFKMQQYHNLSFNGHGSGSCASDFDSPIVPTKLHAVANDRNDGDKNSPKRSFIEQQLMSMDKLFGEDDSSSSEESDGDSFGNDDIAQFDVERRIEERKKVQETTDLRLIFQSSTSNFAATVVNDDSGDNQDYQAPLKMDEGTTSASNNNDQLNNSNHSTSSRGVQSHSRKTRPPFRRSLSGDVSSKTTVAGAEPAGKSLRRTVSNELAGMRRGSSVRNLDTGSAHSARKRPSIKRAASMRRKVAKEAVHVQIDNPESPDEDSCKASRQRTRKCSKSPTKAAQRGGQGDLESTSSHRKRNRAPRSLSPTRSKQRDGGGDLESTSSHRRKGRGPQSVSPTTRAKLSVGGEGGLDNSSLHRRQHRLRRDALSRSEHCGSALSKRRRDDVLSQSEHGKNRASGTSVLPRRNNSAEGLRVKGGHIGRPPRRHRSFDDPNTARRMRGFNSDDGSAKSNRSNWNSSSQTSPTTSPRLVKENTELGLEAQESWDYKSCIAMINAGREKRGFHGLTANNELDKEAQKHAQAVADSNGSEIAALIDSQGHVLRGTSVVSIHAKVIESESSRARDNILNPDFNLVGIGIAQGKDDNKIYVCELFRGKYTLVLEDTE